MGVAKAERVVVLEAAGRQNCWVVVHLGGVECEADLGAVKRWLGTLVWWCVACWLARRNYSSNEPERGRGRGCRGVAYKGNSAALREAGMQACNTCKQPIPEGMSTGVCARVHPVGRAKQSMPQQKTEW